MINCHEIEYMGCKYFNTTLTELKSKKRYQPAVNYRYIIWRALYDEGKLNMSAIARKYGKDRTLVTYGIGRTKISKDLAYQYELFHNHLKTRESVDKPVNKM